jgi:hypothetical protein
MPKQPFDKPHKLRLNYVWQAIEQLGRAGTTEICANVAAKMGVSEVDASFKRNIYRDLKQLVDASEVYVEHFTADGKKVQSEEELESISNFRSEYFSAEKPSEVLGGGLLRDVGAELYTPDNKIVRWRIVATANGLPSGTVSILLPNSQGQWIALSADIEQRPIQLVVRTTCSSFIFELQFDKPCQR